MRVLELDVGVLFPDITSTFGIHKPLSWFCNKPETYCTAGEMQGHIFF
jgi:hypothetical protein